MTVNFYVNTDVADELSLGSRHYSNETRDAKFLLDNLFSRGWKIVDADFRNAGHGECSLSGVEGHRVILTVEGDLI